MMKKASVPILPSKINQTLFGLAPTRAAPAIQQAPRSYVPKSKIPTSQTTTIILYFYPDYCLSNILPSSN